MRTLLLVSATVLASASCIKDSTFVATEPGGGGILDIDAPDYLLHIPTTVGPYNISGFDFEVNDAVGLNGAPPSGTNFSTVAVRYGQVVLPLSRTGNRFRADVSGVPDGGPFSLLFSGADNRGNQRQWSRNFTFDRTDPEGEIVAGSTPLASSASSIPFTFSGYVRDPNLGSATLRILNPGPNGTCGDTDDVLRSKGTTGGDVSENTFTLQPGANGTYSVGFTAYNGVSAGGQAVTAVYCPTLTASDNAIEETGADNPNTFKTSLRKELTWQPLMPTPVSYSVTGCHRHVGPNDSFVRFTVTGTPASGGAGAAYTFQVTGPGVVGPASHTGAMPVGGSVALQTNINLFGTYNLTGNVGGIAVSGSDVVDASQTCP